MWEGRVKSLHITSAKSLPMQTVDSVTAIAGVGLEGDRYALGVGTYSDRRQDVREITFFETETLDAIEREFQITLRPDQTRRNVITEGVPLNHLVGRKFHVGQVAMEGMRLCHPCQYLEDLLGVKSLFKSLVHRGGLNCRILAAGQIHTGDVVRI